MNGQTRKISKAKGVQICADELYSGKPRKEILPVLVNTYGVSVSTIEKWLKEARVIVEERNREDEAIRKRESEAAVMESAKRLNLTKERILEEYAKIAFFDIRKIFTVDGGLRPMSDIDDNTAGALSGIESFDERVPDTGELLGTARKIKIWDKRAALDSICRVLGYDAPHKVTPVDPNGEVLPIKITLNLS